MGDLGVAPKQKRRNQFKQDLTNDELKYKVQLKNLHFQCMKIVV